MRKLEKQMNFAISNKGNWAGSNTTVRYNEATNCSQVLLHGHQICTFDHNTQVTYNEFTNCSSVYLHGHQIATFDHDTLALKLSSCGYETVTTKSRLNAILEEVKYGCRVFQKNFNWFVRYNNQTQSFWDGMILLNRESLEVA